MRAHSIRFSTILALVLLLVGATVAPVAAQADGPSGVVNINAADVATLQMLPRVGPAVAQRIVEHREQNGAFREKTDLLLVRGIGDATFERLEPYVSLEGPTTLDEKVRSPRKPRAESDSSASSSEKSDG